MPSSQVDEIRRLPVADLCLVSSVKTKLSQPAPAKELYASAWFRRVSAVVKARGWPWHILSEEYGLLDPERDIGPYDKTLNRMPKSERVEWSRRVISALDPRLASVGSVVIFAGMKYREFLIPALRERGIEVCVPMKGLRNGEQLAQLNRWLGR